MRVRWNVSLNVQKGKAYRDREGPQDWTTQSQLTSPILFVPLLCSAKRFNFSISSSAQVPEALAVAGGGADVDVDGAGAGAACSGCIGMGAEAGVGCLLTGKGAEAGASCFAGVADGGGIEYAAGYGYG